MVSFQTKNLEFWRAFEWKRLAYIFYGHLEYITAIWYIPWPFGNFVAMWYLFPRFGVLCQEKSGNPAPNEEIQYCFNATNL
jgi:hypothetical protein